MRISVILTCVFEVHCKLQLFLDHKPRLYLPCKRVPKSLQHHWCFSSGASGLPLLHPTDPRPKLTAREPGHFRGFGRESGPRPSHYLHFSGITETSGHTCLQLGLFPRGHLCAALSPDTLSTRTSTSPALPSRLTSPELLVAEGHQATRPASPTQAPSQHGRGCERGAHRALWW